MHGSVFGKLSCCAAIAIIFTACGGGSGDGESSLRACDAFRVLNGEQCFSDSLPVVSLRIRRGAQEAGCTGTIISNDTVLTAAHCVANSQGAQAIHDRGTQSATSGAINPLYDFDSTAFDTAILRFPNIASNFRVTPAKILISRRIAVGDKVKVVAYGSDGTPSLENGNPRGAELTIQGINSGLIGTVFDDGSKGVCFGDSGAAITLNGQIVGTVHGGINLPNVGSCASGNVNIFTDMQIKGNAEFVKTQDPSVVFE